METNTPTFIGDDTFIINVVQQKSRARHWELVVARCSADERPCEGRLARADVAIK